MTAPTRRTPATRRLHVAFAAPTREQVDEFWRVGTEAGYADDGSRGRGPQYRDDYYGAFLLDPDGNSAEAVHHGALRRAGSSTTSGSAWPTSPRPSASTRRSRRTPACAWETTRPSACSSRGSAAARSRSCPATPTENLHMAFPSDDDGDVQRFHQAAIDAGYTRQRPARRAAAVPPRLLRRLRPRSRRQQHRGRQPPPGLADCSAGMEAYEE